MREKKKIVKVFIITVIWLLLLAGCFIVKKSKKEIQYKSFLEVTLSESEVYDKTQIWHNKLLLADYEVVQKKVADINQDGIINETDFNTLYNFLIKCSAELPKRTDRFVSGDVDFDGKVDLNDAYIIKSFYENPAE